MFITHLSEKEREHLLLALSCIESELPEHRTVKAKLSLPELNEELRQIRSGLCAVINQNVVIAEQLLARLNVVVDAVEGGMK